MMTKRRKNRRAEIVAKTDVRGVITIVIIITRAKVLPGAQPTNINLAVVNILHRVILPVIRVRLRIREAGTHFIATIIGPVGTRQEAGASLINRPLSSQGVVAHGRLLFAHLRVLREIVVHLRAEDPKSPLRRRLIAIEGAEVATVRPHLLDVATQIRSVDGNDARAAAVTEAKAMMMTGSRREGRKMTNISTPLRQLRLK